MNNSLYDDLMTVKDLSKIVAQVRTGKEDPKVSVDDTDLAVDILTEIERRLILQGETNNVHNC